MADETLDERITKRRVTMTNYSVQPGDDGKPVVTEYTVQDYVRPDFLDAYVEDAKTRWQNVTVSDLPDPGPGGFHGATYVPEHLDVEGSGLYFPATSGSDAEKALIKSGDVAAVATEGSDKPVLLSTILADTQEG